MKDIILDKWYKKTLYIISIFLMAVSWINLIIILFLYNYGKNTTDNQDKKENVLNKTYQKYIYFLGIGILIFILIFSIILFFSLR